MATGDASTSDTTYTLAQAESDIATLRGQVDLLSEILQQTDGGVVPAAPAASTYAMFSGSGQQKYVGVDTNAYNTGRACLYKTSAQTISSTGATAVTFSQGNTLAVAAAGYQLRIVGSYLENASAGTPSFEVTGPATANVLLLTRVYPANAGSATPLTNKTTSLNSSWTLNTMASTTRMFIIEGLIVFTASGSLGFSALTSAGADTFNIQAGTFLELSPIT